MKVYPSYTKVTGHRGHGSTDKVQVLHSAINRESLVNAMTETQYDRVGNPQGHPNTYCSAHCTMADLYKFKRKSKECVDHWKYKV